MCRHILQRDSAPQVGHQRPRPTANHACSTKARREPTSVCTGTNEEPTKRAPPRVALESLGTDKERPLQGPGRASSQTPHPPEAHVLRRRALIEYPHQQHPPQRWVGTQLGCRVISFTFVLPCPSWRRGSSNSTGAAEKEYTSLRRRIPDAMRAPRPSSLNSPQYKCRRCSSWNEARKN